MRKDAFYFPHDSNAKDDPKIVMLIEQLGLEGYGIYWVLVETLRDQPDYQYPIALLPAIARRYATTKDKVEIVVMNYGLFTVTEDGQFFLSPSLCRRMELYDQKKQRLSIAGKKGRLKQIDMGQARATPKQGPSIAQATPGQEKIREEKIIEERVVVSVKRFTPPSLEDVSLYCSERKNNVDPEKWIDHYTSNGWKVGSNSMRDWKASIRTWEKGPASTKPSPPVQKIGGHTF